MTKKITHRALYTRKRIITVRIENSCWIWTGARYPSGYAKVKMAKSRKVIQLSRLMLAAKLGRPLLAGMCACHHCDNPPCVNPDCLFEGTQKDNNDDMKRKGRRNDIWIKEIPPCAKLTIVQVQEIKQLFSEGWTNKALAKKYQVGTTAISNIRTNTTWKHHTRTARRLNV